MEAHRVLNMDALFDILPGIPMPVDDVNATLSKMWEAEQIDGELADSDFRASQMNLILHFGLKTTGDEAICAFNQAIEFAQRYPCRIIILSPQEETKGDAVLKGKLYSQCFIGNTDRELCCCEALILGYAIDESTFLENQVSLWLESDLPTYHWFHRVPSKRIEDYYLPFLKRCRRVLFDSEIEGKELLAINWPSSIRVSDLSFCRTLPLRQHVGQFLSAYPSQNLIEKLKLIRLSCVNAFRSEADYLDQWQKRGIGKCADEVAVAFDSIQFDSGSEKSENTIQSQWEFDGSEKYLEWKYNFKTKNGLIKSNIDGYPIEHTFHAPLLGSTKTLAEAIFF